MRGFHLSVIDDKIDRMKVFYILLAIAGVSVVNSIKFTDFDSERSYLLFNIFFKALHTANGIPLASNQTGTGIFSELDDFSVMEILDFLSFGDLATIVAMDPRHYHLVWDHYIGAVKGASLRIVVSNIDPDTRAYFLPTESFAEYNKLCTGHNHMLATLKSFCHAFVELDITFDYSYNYDSNITTKIVSYVNTYCSMVPQKITMRRLRGSAGEFAFQNASSVVLRVSGDFSNFTVAKHFPRVQELSIDLYEPFALKQHLPHLRHFELMDISCGNFDLREFGKMNSQIRSVNVELCGNLKSVQEVNEIFPKLESLYYKPKRVPIESDHQRWPFGRRQNTVQSVRFRNVKQYTIDLSSFYSLGQYGELDADSLADDKHAAIEFDQLESLEYVSHTYNHRNDQIDFVLHYNEVHRLNITSFVMTYGHMKRLVDSLPRLKEIQLRCTSPRDLLQIMSDTRLDTIHVLLLVREATRADFLQATLPANWYVDASSSTKYTNIITFKRNLFE